MLDIDEAVIEIFGVSFGWWAIVVFLADLTIRILAVIYVPRNRMPSAAMGWLLAIFFIPFAGVFLFLLIGNPKLPRKRRKRQDDINSYIASVVAELPHDATLAETPEWLPSLVYLNQHLGGFPLMGGNSATLHADYGESLQGMIDDIDRAVDWVHVEFYILCLDETTAPFFDALENAEKRGVEVRVLFDHVASLRTRGYHKMTRRLTAMGADWHRMLPLDPLKWKWQRPDLRNHRKLLVVDGSVAWIGSQNIIDRSYNKRSNIRRGLKWQELQARVDGPVVGAINAIFLTDWYSETDELLIETSVRREEVELTAAPVTGDLACQVVPSGPGFEGENNLRLFLGLLWAAQERIVITSPYFVPDEPLLYAVTTAVQRGVPVDLFVSEIGDQPTVYHAQRSYYEALLRAGVRIFLYPKPFILHSKHFTIDSEVAVLGSSNMDMRSFGLNLEISLLVRGEDFVRDMRSIEDEYRSKSRELSLDEWLKQPLRSTVLDNLARLTSALQ
ncbi:cardiolipin synthetase 2 [Paramicrobacterium humi]|uniref:Cardiolipin synthase n=1 Tax=Paramicrobacterium humi TaxID=640635 RepID=A0A1H4MSW0_9MICO|nr:cardiolipin synthase [Microbacterium humi]SEB85452.1 cardiolipin synthetase 2 [Microbacterium humi]